MQKKWRKPTCVAIGSRPAAMTDFTSSRLAVVVTEAIVAWSTELAAAGAVEVDVTDGAIAVQDRGQQRWCGTQLVACPRSIATATAAVQQALSCQSPDQRPSTSCTRTARTCSQCYHAAPLYDYALRMASRLFVCLMTSNKSRKKTST